jgi:D-arabinose 1-dehydrogenase-like Zn-dependent alcohol dehydrogenase
MQDLGIRHTGWENLCEKQLNTGYFLDGSYAEYVKGYAKYVGKVPHRVDPLDAAPLTCAGLTTYNAVKVSGAKTSERKGKSSSGIRFSIKDLAQLKVL